MTLVVVNDLQVELADSGAPIVSSISFTVDAKEIVALVGESGSGKTTIATAMLGYVRRGARLARGSITVSDQSIVPAPPDRLAALRGRVVSYVPQDPASALNPGMRIGTQLRETLAERKAGSAPDEHQLRIRRVLEEVQLPTDDRFLKRFPHQLSGGQQQRICIAMALVCDPRLIVLDEPTTGLDVTTQARVLSTVSDLVAERGIAAIYVTHDLAVVANIAARVIVLYAGRIAESGPTARIFERASHPYTRRLLRAIPDVSVRRGLDPIPGRSPEPGAWPPGCSFAPRCLLATDLCRTDDPELRAVANGTGSSSDHLVRCHHAQTGDPLRADSIATERSIPSDKPDLILKVRDVSVRYGSQLILDSVSMDVTRGECVAVVGESGSGKTTLSYTILGLVRRIDGEILYEGQALPADNRSYPEKVRREVQYIFQSPYNSINPRRSIGATIASPIRQFHDERGRAAMQRAVMLLDRVSLSPRILGMYPQELSGGERQRVAIARALVSHPRLLVCDEITSSLDVSVQASIVSLLESLRESEHLSLIFVTHNMALVRTLADQVIVLERGRIVESGRAGAVLDYPKASYTTVLLGNTPRLKVDGSR